MVTRVALAVAYREQSPGASTAEKTRPPYILVHICARQTHAVYMEPL